jgi:hypothetical protein
MESLRRGMTLLSRVTGRDNPVQVRTYGSNYEMQRDARRMIRRGYRLEGQSGQFNKWKLVSGSDTVTCTWVKDSEGDR